MINPETSDQYPICKDKEAAFLYAAILLFFDKHLITNQLNARLLTL